jgi:hypothetical protein
MDRLYCSCGSESIQCCFEDQAFDLLPHNPPTPHSPISKLDRRHTGRMRKRDNMPTGGGRGGGRSQIIRRWESLVLNKSFNTLCTDLKSSQLFVCVLLCGNLGLRLVLVYHVVLYNIKVRQRRTILQYNARVLTPAPFLKCHPERTRQKRAGLTLEIIRG